MELKAWMSFYFVAAQITQKWDYFPAVKMQRQQTLFQLL